MLIYGDLRLEDFAEGNLNQQVMLLASRVRRTPDETAPPDALNPALRFNVVTLRLSDGTTRHQRRTRQASLAEGVDVNSKLHRALDDAPPELLAAVSALRSAADLQTLTGALNR